MKIKDRIQTSIVISILLIISIVFIFPYTDKSFILATGESSIYINPSFLNYYTTWENRFNHIGGISSYQVNIFLYSIFWKILTTFRFISPSALFIFLSFFLSSISMYLALNGIVKTKEKLLFLPSCLLYSFNVFRILGPLNSGINIIFVTLPIFFLLYFRFLESKSSKYTPQIVLLSVLASAAGGNLPVFLMPYVLMGIYFIYFILTNKSFTKIQIIKKNIVLAICILLANIFWIPSTILALLQTYSVYDNGQNLFTALAGSGEIHNYIRFIGSWAWNAGNYGKQYYPFAASYNKPLLIMTTYLVAIFSYIHLLKKEKNKTQLFFVFSMIVSFFLLSGTIGLTGFVYDFLYKNVFIFKVFREPFMKFSIIYIFSSAVCITYSMLFISKIFNRKIYSYIITIALSVLILINAYPLFNGEAIHKSKWNGGRSDNFIKIPEYWNSLIKYTDTRRLDDTIFIFPYNTYARSYNFINGASFVGDMFEYLSSKNISRSWSIYKYNGGYIKNILFENLQDDNFDLQKYLSITNSMYILQENDADWRYSNGDILPPSKSNKIITRKGFTKIAEFGKFNEEYLN